MNSDLDKFVRLLQQRRLVEKADDFCASWLDAYIAQDADGRVFIYNGPVVPDSENWIRTTLPCARDARLFLGRLDTARNWRARSFPAAAFQLRQQDWSRRQVNFFEKLDDSGINDKIRAFLNSWKCNCWVARDMNGSIFLYNNRPNIAPFTWHQADPEIGLFFHLDTLLVHELDWQKCLVSFNELRRPIRLASAVDLDISTRMDCWI
jgi:hypothetical protein